jgi:hypothetical protein
MNRITFRALMEEVTKIAGAAGVAARYAKTFTKGNAKYIGKSSYKTLRDMGSPYRTAKRGIKHEFKDVRKKGLKGINKGHVWNAVGAAATAPSALSKEDKSGQGRSRIKRVAAWTGEQAGGFIGAKHGLPGAVVGSMVGRRAVSGKDKKLSTT